MYKVLLYRRAFSEAAHHTMLGKPLSEQVKGLPHLFPPSVAQIVVVGESTGNLSGTLLFLSTMYEEEVQELTKTLTGLLEPILMIVMGCIVGFIAISIITPIYSITEHLNPK